jgi:hypothetical protein
VLGWTAKETIDDTLLSAWRWEQRIRAANAGLTE